MRLTYPHHEGEVQLSDIDLNIGTEVRTALTTMEDDSSNNFTVPVIIRIMFRYDHVPVWLRNEFTITCSFTHNLSEFHIFLRH